MATNFTPKKKKVTGTKSNDKITWVKKKGWTSALTVNAGNGNDIINFKKSTYDKNKLNGGSGKDTIYGGKGNDQITGGKGNDIIYTNSGNDTVFFNKGDGSDTLYKGSGNDTLKFTNFANVSKLKSGLKAKKSGNNLILRYTSKDNVILYNYYKNSSSVKYLMSKDGKTITLADYLATTIFNTYSGKKNKSNKITGSAQNDLIKGNNKNDTLNGGSGNDYVDGGDGNDKLYGGSGNDTIKAGNGNDYIEGGAGNDNLYGQTGTDTFVFSKGSGTDIICDAQSADILKYTDANFADLTFTRNSNDLMITRKNGSTTDKVTILKFFSTNKIDKVITTDGTHSILKDAKINVSGSGTITGTNYNEIILGSSNKDTIYANGGNDYINTEKGDDTVYCGNDNQIIEFKADSGNDTVVLSDGKQTLKFVSDNSHGNTNYSYKIYNNDLQITKTYTPNLISATVYRDVDGKLTLSSTTVKNNKSIKIYRDPNGELTQNSTSQVANTVVGKTVYRDRNGNLTLSSSYTVNNKKIPLNAVIYRYSYYTDSGVGGGTHYFPTPTHIYHFNRMSTTIMLEGVRVNPATLYYCDYNNADTPASWTDYYDEIYVTSDATSTYYNAIYNGTAYYDENGKLTTSATHIVNNTLLNGYYTDYYGNITTNSTTIINNTPLNGNFYYDLNGNIVDEYYQVVDTVNIQNYINSNNDNTFIQFNNNYSVNLQEYLNSQNVPRYKTYEFLSGTGTNIIDDGDANYIITLPKNASYSYNRTIGNNDLIISFGESDNVTIKNYLSGSNISHSSTINGLLINELIANNVNETYDYSSGCNVSKIISNGGTDTLKFANDTNLTFERTIPSSDLIIRYGNKSVTLKNYFNNNHSVTNINGTPINTLINNNLNEIYDYSNGCNTSQITSNGGIDSLKYTNGTTLNFERNMSNNDLIVRDSNRLVTLKDYFLGNHSVTKIGDNNISDLIVNNVNETYTLTDNGSNIEMISNGGIDTLKFPEGLNLIYEHDLSDNDLIIKYGNSSVTLKDYFLGNHSVTKIGENNISDLIVNNVNETYTLTDNASNTEIISNGGTDNLIFPQNAVLSYEHDFATNNLIIYYGNSSVTLKDYFLGNHSVTKIGDNNISDLINNYSVKNTYILTNNEDNTIINSDVTFDTLKFPDGSLIYEHDLSNNDLVIKYGNSSVTLKDYFLGNHSITKIGDNNISDLIANNVNETYTLTDNGSNTEITSNGGTDTLKFPVGSLIYEHDLSNNDLVIKYGNSSVTLKDYYTGNYSVTKIGDNNISDLISNNVNETYTLTDNGSNTEITSNGGTDTLKFPNSLLIYEHDLSNNDLVIKYGNSSVTLKDYFAINNYSVKSIIQNSNLLNIATEIEKGMNIIHSINRTSVTGTNGNDTIINDVNATTNTILGGKGDDYIINEGKVYDSIFGGAGDDEIINNGNIHISTKGTIDGGVGNDTITSEGDVIYVYGGEGNDSITFNGNSSYIFGDEGNDTITANSNSTIEYGISGGDGDDVINYYGGVKDYSIYGRGGINGNNGDDTINIYNSANKVNGEDGNDVIIIHYGNILRGISGGTGNDKLYCSDINGCSFIFGVGDGQDTIYSGSQTDTIEIYGLNNNNQDISTADLTFIKKENDLIINYSDNDNITLDNYFATEHSVKNVTTESGTTSLDTLLVNNVVIQGTESNETINGTNYNDTIYGGNGNKIINAGTGDDLINIGYDNNIIKFSNGDGNDTINNSSINSTLWFTDSQFNELKYSVNNYDLIITYNNNENSVTLKDYMLMPQNLTLKNANEETAYIFDKLIMNPENKSLYNVHFGINLNNMSHTNFNYVPYSDYNSSYQTYTGIHLILYKKVTENEVYKIYYNHFGSGINYHYHDTVNLTLKVNEKTTNRDLYNGYSIDFIYYASNSTSLLDKINKPGTQWTTYLLGGVTDNILMGSDYDYFVGGEGNDYLYGGNNNKTTFLFSSGDGNDIIYSYDNNDEIEFTDVNLSDISVSKSENDIILSYGETDTIRLINEYTNAYDISIKGANGSKKSILNMYRNIIDNSITQETTIYGTLFNDSIISASGIDEIIYSGTGNDIIQCNGGNDIIDGGDGKNKYIYSTVASGNDTIINGIGDDTICFETETSLSYSKPADSNDLIITHNSGTINLKDFFVNDYHSVNTINNGGTISNIYDQLYFIGIQYNNITSNGDTITGTQYKDIIYTNTGNDTIYGYDGDDDIYGGDGNDYIIGGNGNDTIYGENGNDHITGDAGNNLLCGGKGNDILNGGTGNNTYVFNVADGQDTIVSGSGDDTISFNTSVNLSYSILNNDYIISYGDNDYITLKDYFSGYHSVETIINGEDTIYLNEKFIFGTNGADSINAYAQDGVIIIAKSGNDEISGSSLNDILYGNDGNDWIDGYEGDDIIYGGSGDDELFGGWGNNSNTIYGGEGFDQLHGCDGNDFLYGEAGDDLLVASQGNDYLDGGSGFNQIAYVFADECNEGDELASGHDIIANGEGEDTIYFSYFNREANTQDDSKPAILSYDINNSDLVITYNQDNTITLKDFFVSYSHSVKTINNCGTKIDIDDVISQLISTGSTSNDTITASDDGDIIFTGEGNDVIYVGLGNDIVNGCTGNDTIYSGAGNNILYGGSSDDSYIISNLTNFDTIYDKAGYNDIVNINNINKNDLVIRFDIKIDETGNIIEDESKNMYITSTSDFGSTTKGIKVTDQFVVGHSIETITTADNYKLTTTQINTLRENVASWLHTNGFESVQQILDSNNTTNINNLIAEFQKADWQQV